MRYELTGPAQYIVLALAIPAIYFGLNAISRWLSWQADRWEDDGVIRGAGFAKIWKEDSPKKFSAFVGFYRFHAIFWWVLARAVPGILVLVLAVALLASAFHAVLTRS